jgi:acylphosphatase
MADSRRIRQLAYFQGRVQGVGFRMTTRRLASEFEVTGYVRNLPDGRVEVVAEGSAAEVDGFFARIRATMGQYVRHCDIHRLPATGEFGGFTIEY